MIVVGGPAGCGKLTVSEQLSEHLHCPVIDGDDLHPKENVDKMSNDIPLNDEDRWPWLVKVATHSTAQAETSPRHTAVISCSMLKWKYRDFIKENAPKTRFAFVFLHLTEEETIARVLARQGHYMKKEMVELQYAIMELPAGTRLVANGGDEVDMSVLGKTREEVLEEVLGALREGGYI